MNIQIEHTSAAATSSVNLAQSKQGARNFRGITTKGVVLKIKRLREERCY